MKDRKSLIVLALVAVIGVVATGSSSARTTSHRGGTLKLLANAAGGTLDPQVNYTLQYWQLYQATYDGLLAFQKAGGSAAFNVVPDLAASYKITNGGKSWVFTLRKGIKFSNGRPVTANDVVASFRRIFKVKSPTAGGFYNGIVGAAKCLKTPATCTLAGGISGRETPSRSTSPRPTPSSSTSSRCRTRRSCRRARRRATPDRRRSPEPGRTTSRRTTRTSSS